MRSVEMIHIKAGGLERAGAKDHEEVVKYCVAAMMPSTRLKKIVGVTSGRVIFRVFCQGLAPSISAAS